MHRRVDGGPCAPQRRGATTTLSCTPLRTPLRTPLAMLCFTLSFMLSGGCAMLPQPIGVVDGKLRPCPAAPHCVSSDDADMLSRIAPLAIKGDPAAAWAALRSALLAMPRVVLLADDMATDAAAATAATAAGTYLHFTASTATMGYTDDVEFVLRAERGEIAMRSCSRVGYYDFGVNRTRLERVRMTLRDRGVLE